MNIFLTITIYVLIVVILYQYSITEKLRNRIWKLKENEREVAGFLKTYGIEPETCPTMLYGIEVLFEKKKHEIKVKDKLEVTDSVGVEVIRKQP